MSGFIYEKSKENIVTITMDMDGPVNAINDEFSRLIEKYMDRLEQEKDQIDGVIITSAKSTFLAGGDLKAILSFEKGDEEKIFELLEKTKSFFRRLEQLGKPVVAAINGSALGGGCELALSCHHRIVLDSPKIEIGMPEVTLGLLPGAGGIVRSIRMLGLHAALPLLLEGRRLKPAKALSIGLVDELAEDKDDMTAKALRWIKENPEAMQPWDKEGYRIPGGDARNPKITQALSAAPGMLYKKTKGAMPAPEKILAAAAESLRVDVDTALRIESRYLAYLMVTPEAKNMISTFFFQLNDINSGSSRPKDIEKTTVKKLGILGAGMMGQGIAYVAAKAGIEVILKDVSQEAANKGKAFSEKLCGKLVEKKKMAPDVKTALLDRILPTEKEEDLQGSDLIIEAVFENMELKKKIFKDTEHLLTPDGVYGSNTSTLPITALSDALEKPKNFIGIHFFSPVEKMPLVEIIKGKKTSDAALAKAFDFVRKIKKIPIVVNDGRGFFTTRVISSFMDEGCRLLEEGVNPLLIDRFAGQTGMPVGPLTVLDEVSQELSKKIGQTNQDLDDARGENFNKKLEASLRVGGRLVDEFNRGGRAHGGGFYEYPKDGPKQIWPKLYELYHKPDLHLPDQDIKDRLIFRQVIEAVNAYEEGVVTSFGDANIGSIMGIGFPPQSGGVFQHINSYGTREFVQRSVDLLEKYGSRFQPPESLVKKAETGEVFA